MSCCGKARAQARAGAPASSVTTPLVNEFPFGAVIFEYTGATSLAIIGPPTRKTYLFGGQGSRVMVDQRDSGSFAMVRALRRI